MAETVPKITLSNGVKMPSLGYGTWLSDDANQLKTALRAALDCGYRYIDTAALYKNEAVIGSVLQEYYDAGIFKREDVFLATKLPFYGHGHAEKFLTESLSNLKTDYVDLYLIHMPLPSKLGPGGEDALRVNGEIVPELIPLIETWKFLEKHYKAGILKSIGISNFNAKQIQEIYDLAEVKPHNLQIELHILFPQNELVDLCRNLNISVTSYGPLGSPGSAVVRAGLQGNCLGNPLVVELAKKYNKSPAQILLRQIVQRGLSVIPKSTNLGRVKENFNVFDFELSQGDMKRFEEITERVQLFHFGFARHHPYYPWPQYIDNPSMNYTY